MFFFLSKTLNIFVMPMVVVCLCFLFSVLIKKQAWKKRLFWAGFILLFLFSNDFITNEVALAWEVKAKPFSEMRHYEIGIVLTGTTIEGLFPKDRVYFNRGADRVIHTVQLYKLGLIKKILISGGNGHLVDMDEPEAVGFKKVMIVMGVPEEDIMTESETRNTHESAVEVKKLLAQLGYKGKDCLLITSAFHMRRSLACYRKVGLEVESFSTDFYSHPRVYYADAFIVPRVESIAGWTKIIREWVGFIAYKMAGYV